MVDLADGLIGEYVLCRTRMKGVVAGYLKAADETGCILTQARRLWYHKPIEKEFAWYEGVSEVGLHPDSNASCPKDWILIREDYALVYVTETAKQSIMNHPSYEQK